MTRRVQYFKTTAEALAEKVKTIALVDEYADIARGEDGKYLHDAEGDLVWIPKTRHPQVFISDTGAVCISAEDGCYFADYYGEGHGDYPWVHEAVEAFAKEHDLMVEWQNPGAIGLYQN